MQQLLPATYGSAGRAAALRYATSLVAALPYDPDDPMSVFGHYLAVSLPSADLPQQAQHPDGERLWWLPPPLSRMRSATGRRSRRGRCR